MTDGLTAGAVLLVAGPVAGAVALSNPALLRVWSAPRDEHLALVRAHRRAWTAINAGLTVATVVTAAGDPIVTARVAASPRAARLKRHLL